MKINSRRKSVVQTRRHLNLVDHASGSQVNFLRFFYYRKRKRWQLYK